MIVHSSPPQAKANQQQHKAITQLQPTSVSYSQPQRKILWRKLKNAIAASVLAATLAQIFRLCNSPIWDSTKHPQDRER